MLALTARYPQRRAFITGAASGLGLALAERLAGDGWQVGLADVQELRLQRAVLQVRALGGRGVPYLLDVTEAAAFHEAAQTFVTAHGGIDLVINNAGIATGGWFDETSLADWEATLDVNLRGVLHGCRAFVAPLLRQGQGHLINIASLAAIANAPMMSAYNVSKAGVRSLSETLYHELGPQGVDVSVVMPAFFRSDIARTVRGSDDAQDLTQKLVNESGSSATDVAAHLLREAASAPLHICYPRTARLFWWWKRLAPGHYHHTLRGRSARLHRRRAAPHPKASAPVA
ncbi:MAG: SDR family NAD(P)-dependent oxidoreductase [Bacteroidetes bacterium]|nr:SDR family NAD(P)-dependent oxidoreductase [Bacteroidota bacterium]